MRRGPVWGLHGPGGYFNPRTPCGVRPWRPPDGHRSGDFNPRTPCGVRPPAPPPGCPGGSISIHAPRVGCDKAMGSGSTDTQEFQSTHPVWGATGMDRLTELHYKFQSTHPVWGATAFGDTVYGGQLFQSTHPVWGATDPIPWVYEMDCISIHAPRVGCDPMQQAQLQLFNDFNPRTPCGVRPWLGLQDDAQGRDFNPRTPCGVRPAAIISTPRMPKQFQSTHPVWGATWEHQQMIDEMMISIHAPRVGCDGREDLEMLQKSQISIHAPRVGCDAVYRPIDKDHADFNPRTPCGVRRPGDRGRPWGRRRFQSTHPVWGATANLYKVRGESLCSLHRLHSINSKCYNCGGEKISTPYTNWKNVCANLPGML